MSCGFSWMIKGTSSGCGLPKISQPVRLSVAISAHVLGMLQGHYGPGCHLCTDNVPSSIPITGRPMKQHCASKRHRAVGKESGLTSYIERFNNTKAATSVTASKKDIIVLFEVRQSHWRNLEFHPSLQCTDSF